MSEQIRFTKMQGVGNDYIYINGFEQHVNDPGKLARRISDRHFGVGADGLVLILPSASADVRMRIFKADGTEAEMCGNAACCVGRYVHDHGIVSKDVIRLETASGLRIIRLRFDGGQICGATVDMEAPVLAPSRIPVSWEPSLLADGEQSRFIAQPVEVDGRVWAVTAVSMGNPFAVVFVDRVEEVDVPRLGPLFERHSVFPHRTNVAFVQVLSSDRIRMRVWECGSGETMASGTGACAAAVASLLNGYTGRKLEVEAPGGLLGIHWDKADEHLYMTGTAEMVFDGVYRL
ncbi:MAG: diaminopimelate epimerase [Desulfovibrio sp.]|nr:diaminopimelate epimerase [Desulfovibrio sp.]